jgi:2'-5' RNA ligase
MTDNYSIWIKPAGHMYEKLQQEIATQAKELGAPLFEPHVTLLPDIQGDQEQIIATMQQLAQDLKVGSTFFHIFSYLATQQANASSRGGTTSC